MTCNTYGAQSSKHSVSALTTAEIVNSLYTFEDLINIQNNPAAKYEASILDENIQKIVEITSVTKMTNYPFLDARIKQSSITVPEFAQFLDFSGYSQYDINVALNDAVTSPQFQSATSATRSYTPSNNVAPILSQLDFYYNKNFANSITGGFCRTFASILSLIPGLIHAGIKKIAELKNSVASVIASLQSIKTILQSLVDQLKEKLISIVKKFTDTIANMKNGFLFLSKKAKDVIDFFSDTNMKNIKDKIEEIIAKMGAGYKKITPEVLQYILYRLCQLTEIVHAFMQSPVDGLRSLMGTFTAQQTALQNSSNFARLSAVNAGAYRMSPAEVRSGRVALQHGINGNVKNVPESPVGGYITGPMSDQERRLIQSILNASASDMKSLSYEAASLITFTSGVQAMPDPYVGAGWKLLQPSVLVIALRVAKRNGLTLLVNSGYRGPNYNRKIGGAKSSMHMSGKALDILRSSFGNGPQFIQTASEEGAGGIGLYSGFIHIDSGPVRGWGSSGNANEKVAQNHHVNGAYIKRMASLRAALPPVNQESSTTGTQA